MCNFFSREMEGDETQNITIKPCRLPVWGFCRLGSKVEGRLKTPRWGSFGPKCLPENPKAQRTPESPRPGGPTAKLQPSPAGLGHGYATSRSARGAAPCMPCDPNQIRDGMRAVPCLPLLMTQVRAGPGECRAYGARIIFGIGPSPAGLG